MDILAGYTRSIFQDSETYPRTEVDLVEDDIRLSLDDKNSRFLTNGILPTIWNFKDLSEFFLGNLQPEYEGVKQMVNIEYDDISTKTNWLSDLALSP